MVSSACGATGHPPFAARNRRRKPGNRRRVIKGEQRLSSMSCHSSSLHSSSVTVRPAAASMPASTTSTLPTTISAIESSQRAASAMSGGCAHFAIGAGFFVHQRGDLRVGHRDHDHRRHSGARGEHVDAYRSAIHAGAMLAAELQRGQLRGVVRDAVLAVLGGQLDDTWFVPARQRLDRHQQVDLAEVVDAGEQPDVGDDGFHTA